MGNFNTSTKFLRKAFNEYRCENNERKISNISNTIGNISHSKTIDNKWLNNIEYK